MRPLESKEWKTNIGWASLVSLTTFTEFWGLGICHMRRQSGASSAAVVGGCEWLACPGSHYSFACTYSPTSCSPKLFARQSTTPRLEMGLARNDAPNACMVRDSLIDVNPHLIANSLTPSSDSRPGRNSRHAIRPNALGHDAAVKTVTVLMPSW